MEENFRMRRSPQLIVLALVLATASACSDSTSARLMAPGDVANSSKTSNSQGVVSRTYTSQDGVTATTYDGNTSGEGNSSCSALGLGSTGTKVDGAYSQSVAGYKFTVSGSEKQFLAFAPIAGTTPTTSILAVIVKGGPAFNVYKYTAGQTSDAGLTAPVNGGGNIPTISHYVVCYGPGPVTPPVFTKTLKHVSIMVNDQMADDPNWSTGQPITIPLGETRWVEYRLDYSLPAGVTATITEDNVAVCGTASPGVHCSFNTAGVYSWTVSGTGFILVDLDLAHQTGCGNGSFVNTAKLNIPGRAPISASAPSTLNLPCATFTKTLRHVSIMVNDQMADDPVWSPGQPITIPLGETRWVEYRLDYSLPAGVTATITEDNVAVCGTASPGVHCSFNTAGVYSWTVSGTGFVLVDLDLAHQTGCGDGSFVNTAKLNIPGQAPIPASAPSVLKLTCP